MCTPEILDWVHSALSAVEVYGGHILEIGSYNVNGSLRNAVLPWQPASYTGVDMRSGPGVDIVCRAEHLVDRFGAGRFDLVLSSCTFEHVRNWRPAMEQMKLVCRPGGLIIFIVPHRFYFHAYPNDYWRFSPADLKQIFADCEILRLDQQGEERIHLFAKVRKPLDYYPQSLDTLQLYCMAAGRRTRQVRAIYYASPHFLGLVWHDLLRRKLSLLRIYVQMGIQIRLLRPMRRAFARLRQDERNQNGGES
jgi:SAM-dependent methyltransferase